MSSRRVCVTKAWRRFYGPTPRPLQRLYAPKPAPRKGVRATCVVRACVLRTSCALPCCAPAVQRCVDMSTPLRRATLLALVAAAAASEAPVNGVCSTTSPIVCDNRCCTPPEEYCETNSRNRDQHYCESYEEARIQKIVLSTVLTVLFTVFMFFFLRQQRRLGKFPFPPRAEQPGEVTATAGTPETAEPDAPHAEGDKVQV